MTDREEFVSCIVKERMSGRHGNQAILNGEFAICQKSSGKRLCIVGLGVESSGTEIDWRGPLSEQNSLS